MAIICTYCGREVPPGSSVCPACGQTVSAVSTPAFTPVAAANPGSVPPAYAQSATPYATPPPPAGSGSPVVKILLIVIAVVVFVGVAFAALIGIGVWRASKALHMDKKGDTFSITTPSGTITSGGHSSISEVDLGVPIYPGATRGEGSMNLKTPNGSLVSSNFNTSDSPSKVVDFYKGKLGENASTVESGSSTMITLADNNANKVLVTVSSDGGQTKILIMHTTRSH